MVAEGDPGVIETVEEVVLPLEIRIFPDFGMTAHRKGQLIQISQSPWNAKAEIIRDFPGFRKNIWAHG